MCGGAGARGGGGVAAAPARAAPNCRSPRASSSFGFSGPPSGSAPLLLRAAAARGLVVCAHGFWNYLHRQLFVLDTYASPHNRRTNHTGLAVFVAVPVLLGFGVLAALANILRFRLLAVSAAGEGP